MLVSFSLVVIVQKNHAWKAIMLMYVHICTSYCTITDYGSKKCDNELLQSEQSKVILCFNSVWYEIKRLARYECESISIILMTPSSFQFLFIKIHFCLFFFAGVVIKNCGQPCLVLLHCTKILLQIPNEITIQKVKNWNIYGIWN